MIERFTFHFLQSFIVKIFLDYIYIGTILYILKLADLHLQ
jgi:hypothetical protein